MTKIRLVCHGINGTFVRDVEMAFLYPGLEIYIDRINDGDTIILKVERVFYRVDRNQYVAILGPFASTSDLTPENLPKEWIVNPDGVW
jgi:hypothetical protein